jgi:hypothetical protein
VSALRGSKPLICPLSHENCVSGSEFEANNCQEIDLLLTKVPSSWQIFLVPLCKLVLAHLYALITRSPGTLKQAYQSNHLLELTAKGSKKVLDSLNRNSIH